MIRDPSDGSVREVQPGSSGRQSGSAPQKDGIGPVSGLREASPKDKYQARLEWSRNWLKERQEKQNARGNDGEERSTDGDSGNNQGQAEPELSQTPSKGSPKGCDRDDLGGG